MASQQVPSMGKGAAGCFQLRKEVKEPLVAKHEKTQKKVNGYTEMANDQMVVGSEQDDVLKIDDNDLSVEKVIDYGEGDSFTKRDIADGDVYNKKTPFSNGLSKIQRDALALHLESVRREYEKINHDDEHAVNNFWDTVKERIHEDHGFMRRDIDKITGILRKNLE